jgi:hypothetical protein
MFDKKKPIPPIATKIQTQLTELAQPVRRPLLEAMRIETQRKEAALAVALETVRQLTIEVQSARREEMWLSMNPEFDSIYNRLAGPEKVKAATS